MNKQIRPTEITLDTELVKVSATFSQKIQVKQFEPADASCSLSKYCEPDKIKETYDELFTTCKKFVEEKLSAIMPAEPTIESSFPNQYQERAIENRKLANDQERMEMLNELPEDLPF